MPIRASLRVLFVCLVALTALGATASAQTPYYLRSTVGAPWGSSSNEAAMDAVFGAGNWVDARYETVDVATLFARPRFIFMEGSDSNADELEAFLTAHLAGINAFLAAGGVVFFNAAPNEGDGMGFPDGVGASIALNYPNLDYGPTTTSVPGHPIFAGPFPTGTSFTANSVSHAFVTGAGLTPLLNDSVGRMVLAEMSIHAGRALYGGMTLSAFHSPQPAADNFRRNILAYGSSEVRYLPEPASGVSLGAGAIGVGLLALRRRRRAVRGAPITPTSDRVGAVSRPALAHPRRISDLRTRTRRNPLFPPFPGKQPRP